MKTEEIACIPVDMFQPFAGFEGCCLGSVDSLFSEYRYNTLPRNLLEGNHLYKQIVTQTIVIDDSAKLIGIHTIPDTAGEERLHGQKTIFLGGHVEPEIHNGIMIEPCIDSYIVSSNAVREFHEEFESHYPMDRYQMLQNCGFVNSNHTEVNKDHFGILSIAFIDVSEFAEKENVDKGVSDFKLLDVYQALEMYDKRELNSWSHLALPLILDNYLL